MRFAGKIVWVTGGARGIGRAVVQAFAREGATVLFTYLHSEAEAMRIKQSWAEKGGDLQAYQLDITDYDRTATVIEQAIRQFGAIDIVVNNAGITKDGLFMMMEESDWDDVIDTNLKGTFNCCKAVLPQMIAQRSGVIINIASIFGLIGAAGQTNYCASKAGLIGLTRALAKESARKNVRVNAVAPGYIATDMLEQVPEDIRRRFVDKIAAGRLGEVDEVANTVLFLASDDASYIHGQTIVVDGGIV